MDGKGEYFTQYDSIIQTDDGILNGIVKIIFKLLKINWVIIIFNGA